MTGALQSMQMTSDNNARKLLTAAGACGWGTHPHPFRNEDGTPTLVPYEEYRYFLKAVAFAQVSHMSFKKER